MHGTVADGAGFVRRVGVLRRVQSAVRGHSGGCLSPIGLSAAGYEALCAEYRPDRHAQWKTGNLAKKKRYNRLSGVNILLNEHLLISLKILVENIGYFWSLK